jgi:hypothetical protein
VEDNGLWRFFHANGKVRHERFPQLLFFAIADIYCRVNGLDLSPEPNSGRGPVDFKLSQGYHKRFLVEVKYSRNPKLKHGYEVQLAEYEKAEKTSESMFLVIRVTDQASAPDDIEKLADERRRAGVPAPDVFVVDGRYKDSASHYHPDE